MPPKLSSRQQAQADFLQTLPPKFERIRVVVEQMGVLQADEVTVRNLVRLLDETKAQAGALGLHVLGDTLGLMATIARRSGGVQLRVRGLRELLGSLRINYEGALRAATTPEGPAESEEAAGA